MRIEEDIKLDYSDVLFRPKRSTLHSRKDVGFRRTYKFKYSKNEWSGIPIMAAIMDGGGELEIAKNLDSSSYYTRSLRKSVIQINIITGEIVNKQPRRFWYSTKSMLCVPLLSKHHTISQYS